MFFFIVVEKSGSACLNNFKEKPIVDLRGGGTINTTSYYVIIYRKKILILKPKQINNRLHFVNTMLMRDN